VKGAFDGNAVAEGSVYMVAEFLNAAQLHTNSPTIQQGSVGMLLLVD